MDNIAALPPQAIPFQPPDSPRPPRNEQLVVVFSGMLTSVQAKMLLDARFRVVLVQNTSETPAALPLVMPFTSIEAMTWKQVTDPALLFRVGTIIMNGAFPWVSFSPSNPCNSGPPLAPKLVEELLRRGCQALILTNSTAPNWTTESAQQTDAVLKAGARGVARWSDAGLVPTIRSLLAVQCFLHPTTPTISLVT